MKNLELELLEFFQGKIDSNDEEFMNLLENDFTSFMHTIANVVPTNIFNTLSSENANYLEFNHIANKLCFQYMEKTEN